MVISKKELYSKKMRNALNKPTKRFIKNRILMRSNNFCLDYYKFCWAILLI